MMRDSLTGRHATAALAGGPAAPTTDATLVERRAATHRALGDEHRLTIIDLLWHGDRTPAELQDATGLRSNLLAFHLNTLEDAGLVARHPSHGDGRRRYVSLEPAALPHVGPVAPLAVDRVLFVCTHNAARSQLAAALWRQRSGRDALSAGTEPADRVHPSAVAVAADHGLDLSDARPTHISRIGVRPDLVVSVCDRAHETGLGIDAPHRHWSIPDPVGRDRATFEHAFDLIAQRVDRLAADDHELTAPLCHPHADRPEDTSDEHPDARPRARLRRGDPADHIRERPPAT